MCGLMALVVPLTPVIGQSDPVLTVHGSSDVRVAPDLATVRLGIVGQAVNAEVAQRDVNVIANRIFDAVRGLGVDDGDIQTARLILTPVYSRQRNGDEIPEIAAYRASNSVSIRMEDIELVGEVIDAGLGAGANQLQGVSFSARDDLPAREQALEEAIVEARRKADAMAGALGVRLDGILSVDEGGVFVQPMQMEMARVASFQDSASTPVAPGEIAVSASVTIRYRIAQD